MHVDVKVKLIVLDTCLDEKNKHILNLIKVVMQSFSLML